jgi:hypothetical protein
MTVNYTTLLGLAEPVTGTQSGTWGDDVNKGITDYLDIAIAGTQTISGTQTAVTLSITNGSSAASNIAQVASGATGSAQYQIINCTGGPVSLLTITAPASSKTYVVINATSTSQSVKLVAPGPTTGVTVAHGEKAFVVWNGSDFVKVATSTAAPGDVVGPASATDGNLAAFDGTTGKLLKQAATVTVAQGGTGITSFGSGVATFLGTPSSANLAAAVTDETGSGSLVFATSPTLVTPALGTPASGNLSNTTVDGTNKVGYLNIPQSGSAKTTSYTLATTDVGKVIEVGASGAIEVPNSTFATGDAVIIFNNTSGSITMTMTITNAYIAGTDADKATISVATRGVANILFVTGTTCVVTGNVS